MGAQTPVILFEPIDHDSVADAVVDQIENLIVTGVLRQGVRLPAEREMAELLDVSRPKLREALKRLEEKGLLEVRHGEGSFIPPLVGRALSPALTELYARHQAGLFDYLEYRREQEGFAAELAAGRATPSDREVICRLIDTMESAHAAQDEATEQKADIDFHSAVVDASHNSTLIHMMMSIYDLTRRGVFFSRNYIRALDLNGEVLLDQHKAIARAILDRDPAEARRAARGHMEFVEKSFRDGMELEKRETVSRKRRFMQGF
jgi:GntR family transcriptional repressor for pyruvate dehydrogenase complex